MRLWAILLVLLAGCSAPTPQDQQVERNTPLNEEVDEVAKVRDQVTD